MSHFVLKLVKTGVENSEADDTEAINKEITGRCRKKLRDSGAVGSDRRFSWPGAAVSGDAVAAGRDNVSDLLGLLCSSGDSWRHHADLASGHPGEVSESRAI